MSDTALITVSQLPVIQEELRALKERWELKAADAASMVCTEDTVQDLKKIRADIAALKDPPRLIEDNQLSLTLANYSRIIALPGDPATIRGYSGVNLILLDEAAQVSDEFYSAILPMLMVNKGQLICMSTPFGKRGFFYDEWNTGGPDWFRIEVDATQCPRFSPEQLEQQRRSMGDLFYQQEFCCKFVDNATQTFSGDAIMRAFSDEVEVLDIGG